MLAFVHIHIQWIVGIIFIILYCVTILGLVLVIITENRNPLKTIPWVIVLLLAPGIGLLFYFFFGRDLLRDGGIFVMEHPKTNDFSGLPCFYQHRVYGSVNFSIFIKGEEKTDA